MSIPCPAVSLLCFTAVCLGQLEDKADPLPTWLSTPMDAPWVSAIHFATEKSNSAPPVNASEPYPLSLRISGLDNAEI